MVKLYDSEIKVMNLLWEKGSMKAADIAKEMERRVGWNKNTTYTVIKKCVSKGAIERREPGFVCGGKNRYTKIPDKRVSSKSIRWFKP